MFTGLVERTGKVVALQRRAAFADDAIMRLLVDPGPVPYQTLLGDSVAVNGCCLTVVENNLGILAFDLSKETMDQTCFGAIVGDEFVNLERALALGDRLGGHMVSGHVDGIGKIQKIAKEPSGWVVTLEVPRRLGRYLIQKGSICVDGVSLTINDLDDVDTGTLVSLTLIPKTVDATTFRAMQSARLVNVEVDLIGKYIERLQQPWPVA